MRACLFALAAVLAVGCTLTRPITPREYLDEKTAATITTVADPWIFYRDGGPPQLDFVYLYAIDVNRMGEHRQYFVAVKYWSTPDPANATPPSLALGANDRSMTFTPTTDDPVELGIGQPVDPAAPRSATFWFYPIDQAALAAVSGAQALSLALVSGQSHANYNVWRDGSAALNEFAVAVQDW